MDSLELSPKTFDLFRKLVYEQAGISLSIKKHQLLKSRLQKRIRTLDLGGYQAYYELLRTLGPTDSETIEFINAVTTNKTDFFRENHHFEFAVQEAFPSWIAQGKTSFKVWHAGCSTGEEPYSLRMALAESGLDKKIKLSQLATDIDTRVLELAEAGVYESERVRAIPEERLRRLFLRGKGKNQGYYRVLPQFQENLIFRRLNLIEMPWPLRSSTEFDIIFCRNVLIYFDRETQTRLIQGFHSKLVPGGYLFLGHSESIHGMLDQLTSLGKTIYQAKGLRVIQGRAA